MRHKLARITRLLLIVALAVAAMGALACGGDDSSTPTDPVRAHVNGREVHQSAVDAVRAEARFDSRSDDAGKALDQAIDRELVRQEAERLGVSADQAEVDKHAATLADRAGGDEALASLLGRARMTRKQLLESLTYGVLREAVQDARYADVGVGEAKVRRFYERNLKDLFTKPEAVHLAAVFARNEGIASNALKRIRQGQPFDQVSRQFSIDPQLKDAAGDMGWVAPSSIPAGLGKTVDGLRVGEVSRPVQGMGGWYVFKVLGRRAATVIPYAEVRDDLAAELTRRRRSAALNAWLDEARDKAAISSP